MSEAVATSAPVAPPPLQGQEQVSVQAIVTYWLLGNLTLVMIGVSMLIVFQVKVDPVLLGVLGGLILTVSNLAAGAVGYWLGSTAKSNQTVAVAQASTSA